MAIDWNAPVTQDQVFIATLAVVGERDFQVGLSGNESAAFAIKMMSDYARDEAHFEELRQMMIEITERMVANCESRLFGG